VGQLLNDGSQGPMRYASVTQDYWFERSNFSDEYSGFLA
jgi:hypothetical protein